MPKTSVHEALLEATGLVGDKQAHRLFHGGPERALCLYSLEVIRALQAEGHPIYPGSAGENLTISGLDWAQLAPGVRLALGDEVIVELSNYTVPCKTIAASFTGGAFERISHKKYPGWARLYARVRQTGRLTVGQKVRVIGIRSDEGRKRDERLG